MESRAPSTLAVPPPTPPETLQASGLSLDLVAQLVMKTLFFTGELSGTELARRLGVPFGVVEPALELLKMQAYCQIVSGAFMGGASFVYRITTEGRAVAAQYLQQNHYVGAAPVPLDQYRAYLRALQTTGRVRVTRDQVRDAFPHLVLPDNAIEEIGPAINRAHSIFIYGPPGNGKSTIARGLRALFPGHIAIPYALEVEGAVIRVFDPVTHGSQRVPEHAEGLDAEQGFDRRWVICRRPLLQAGGELTLDSLDLSYVPRLGFYRAPLQILANGGILIIDDFGRHRYAAQELLNRWMIPLESGVDYLTLQSGLRFELPFVVFVAFATNLRTADLADEAFLRRVPFKLRASNPTREQFLQIFANCCRDERIPFDSGMIEHVLDTYYASRAIPLRGCHPRDLIMQALVFAEYDGLPRELRPELLARACESYFVEDQS